MPAGKNVLSIQSQVVHGYVGNKSSNLPLQILGWDVDAINTVQFSNHTGYGSFGGKKLTGKEITDIFDGLVRNDIAQDYNAILTGYVPGPEALEQVGRIGEWLLSHNNNNNKQTTTPFLWVMDPVMGDSGKLYVEPAVMHVYRQLASRPHVLCPNQFEAEILAAGDAHTQDSNNLSDQECMELVGYIRDRSSLAEIMKRIHQKYKVEYLVVTSVELPDEPRPDGMDSLFTAASSINDDQSPILIRYPKYDCYFSGTGDLFAAILLDRLVYYSNNNNNNNRLSQSLVEVTTVMNAVLQTTMALMVLPDPQSEDKHAESRVDRSKRHELKLIESIPLIQSLPQSPPPPYIQNHHLNMHRFTVEPLLDVI